MKKFKRTKKKRWRQVVKCSVRSFFRPEARPINKSYDRVGKEGKGESEGKRGKKGKKEGKIKENKKQKLAIISLFCNLWERISII